MVSHDALRQRSADTLKEYCDRVKRRALSDLARISDADFEAGVRLMASAAKRSHGDEPVYEVVDLFVFRLP